LVFGPYNQHEHLLDRLRGQLREFPAHERLTEAAQIADLVTVPRKRASGKPVWKNVGTGEFAILQHQLGVFPLSSSADPGVPDHIPSTNAAGHWASNQIEHTLWRATLQQLPGHPLTHDDPEFAEVVTKQEQNAETKLIVKAHNIDMVPNGNYTAIRIIP
jgi:hypothetical protein